MAFKNDLGPLVDFVQVAATSGANGSLAAGSPWKALIQYLERGRARGRLSRLTLAVIAGKLQSMVPATAGNVGATFLHHLYRVLHEKEDGSSLSPSDPGLYFREGAHMTLAAWEELSWWRQYLLRSDGALVRALDAAVLVSTWGDGSGTGLGGTVQTIYSRVTAVGVR